MIRTFAVLAAVLLGATSVLAAETPSDGRFQIAAGGSCQGFYSQCAARCAHNAKGEPQAKCTADHCGPKLAACRRSGCWQEGGDYGGGKTCGLAK